MTLEEQLKRDEELRLKPYRDTEGKLTIGYGTNLDDGISKEEAEYLFANRLNAARIELAQTVPWVTDLDPVRRAVLENMAYNMGMPRLLEFRKTLALVKQGFYYKAGDEMLDSKWAKQVGARAQRLSLQMKTGIFQ